jgi:integral membrane sensor domain MASE1
MVHLVKGKWISTSIMPVKAGIWGYEMWPDIITSIALSEWKFL